jgi:hypothetical protein
MVDMVDKGRKQAKKAAGMDVVRSHKAYVLTGELTRSGGHTRRSRAVRGIAQLMQTTDVEMSEIAPSLGTRV